MAKGFTRCKALILICVITVTMSACLNRSHNEQGNGFPDETTMRAA
jgi:hypothetical protein